MSTTMCGVYGCGHFAAWKIRNLGTGKVWLMCEFHKGTYEGAPMIVIGQLEEN